MSVDVNRRYVLEEEVKIFNHEVFPCCLWATRTAFVVTACCDHVARGTVVRSADHFSDKVHLSRSNHVADAGDGVKHTSNFVIADSLFADFGH